MSKGNYIDFLNALGNRESNNDYKRVNKYGFAGRWQFGKMRLYDFGYSLNGYSPKNRPVLKFISLTEFLNNPKLQCEIMRKHVESWIKVIEKRYKKYIGKDIAGVNITVSGMVAGLHLKGEGTEKYPGLRQFLESGNSNVDGMGTEITEYIKKFGGYDVYLDITNEIERIDKLAQPKGLDSI